METKEYIFTQNWFLNTKSIWDEIIPKIKPRNILEVGSFEGASTCYLIETTSHFQPIEVHCIDTWEGGVEHKTQDFNMKSVEQRFDHNIQIAISESKNKVDFKKHKGSSDVELSRLIAEGKSNYFDFVYIDGSHQAPDVLLDSALGFKLLKIGGVMVFDDYVWHENLPYGKDPLRCPKLAIDSFININFRKLNIITAPLYQMYIVKTSD